MNEDNRKTSDKLYSINAYISLRYIGLKNQPSYEDICELNRKLGEIIKEIRELEIALENDD